MRKVFLELSFPVLVVAMVYSMTSPGRTEPVRVTSRQLFTVFVKSGTSVEMEVTSRPTT